jgi:hypothetical protein
MTDNATPFARKKERKPSICINYDARIAFIRRENNKNDSDLRYFSVSAICGASAKMFPLRLVEVVSV